jgi:branched-chain amino acid transport system ATP-binding protein
MTSTVESSRMMTKETILTFDNVSMHFGGVKAIDELSFEICRNEIVGIIGPNGAGKTTVFNVLSGVYIPTSGKIIFKETLLNRLPTHAIINSGIARTFQNIRLFGHLSVLDNVRVAFFGRTKYNLLDIFLNTGRKSKEEAGIREEAMLLLDTVGLSEKADLPASSLSYGDQRRLEIARALACKPEILLLDEPAAGMNPNEIDELNKTIVAIKEKFGLTILLVEHQMRLIMGICERIIVMNFGKSLAMGTPSEIRNHKDVLEAYLGKVHKNEK